MPGLSTVCGRPTDYFRDIYYRDPALFSSQEFVDRYVDQIAFTFGVARNSLNVIAAAKGLVAGAVSFCRRDGEIIRADLDPEGLLVPNLDAILSVDMSAALWILVIEKEATFRSLATSDFWQIVSVRGVILTGKGYPDFATRAMLNFLATPSPRNGFSEPQVYGLVDFDPDGIAILSTYRYGSQNRGDATSSHNYPNIHWLGLRREHIDGANACQSLLALSQRDRKKARDDLRRMEENDAVSHDLERAQLQTMLMLNLKAELQLLDTIEGGLFDLLGGL